MMDAPNIINRVFLFFGFEFTKKWCDLLNFFNHLLIYSVFSPRARHSGIYFCSISLWYCLLRDERLAKFAFF